MSPRETSDSTKPPSQGEPCRWKADDCGMRCEMHNEACEGYPFPHEQHKCAGAGQPAYQYVVTLAEGPTPEDKLAKSEPEIKRLREALSWYAEKRHYVVGHGNIGDTILQDNGDKARAALKEAK